MDSTSRIRPERKNIEKLSVFPGLVGRLGSDAIYAGVGEIHAEPGGEPREKDRCLINSSGKRYDSRCFFFLSSRFRFKRLLIDPHSTPSV